MPSLSLKKLGGFALIVGPVLTLIAYQLTPGVFNNFKAVGNHVAVQMQSTGSMAEVSGLLLVVAFVVMLFGFNSLNDRVSGGNGEALCRLGVLSIGVGILLWIAGAALYLAIAKFQSLGIAIDATNPNAAHAGLVGLGEIVFAAGVVVAGLGLTTRDDFNKIATWVFVAAGVVSLILNIFLALDAQIHGILISITYIIWVVWAVMAGLSQIKE
jgi:hypothetical protein